MQLQVLTCPKKILTFSKIHKISYCEKNIKEDNYVN